MRLEPYVRLYNTVKFLKPKQLFYRLYYVSRKHYRKRMGKTPLFSKQSITFPLRLEKSIATTDSYLGNQTFCFLNLSTTFTSDIDWNNPQYGKLWTYNLTYFDFLSQEAYRDAFVLFIEDFIDKIETVSDGMESYPISLRGINWIKFLSYHGIHNQKIDDSLYAQYYLLLDHLEYHLLGNHLLENGFSLLFGAYYFQDEMLYQTAKKILVQELDEQILEDGAHFELSPMYHQIILFRLLEIINLVSHNSWKRQELLPLLTEKASLMLGWLDKITYQDGSIPLLNDSTNRIAPTSQQLFAYAERLDVKTQKINLGESGYRKFVTERYEAVLDVGNIGPDYIPGHAHSDTFSFEIQRQGQPFIVDTGVSTYQSNERRTLERSTRSHNTVEINCKEQSEVWGGFRVAKRAKIIDLQESDNTLQATHDGYKANNIFHTRRWHFDVDKVIIEDELSRDANAIARIHFHPEVQLEDILNSIDLHDKAYTIQHYYHASEFNQLVKALVIELPFARVCNLTLHL